jgi:hypothetical protein
MTGFIGTKPSIRQRGVRDDPRAEMCPTVSRSPDRMHALAARSVLAVGGWRRNSWREPRPGLTAGGLGRFARRGRRRRRQRFPCPITTAMQWWNQRPAR